MTVRYIITERRLATYPTNDDPLASAVSRYSGAYDLRDTESGNVICASGSIKNLRKVQAKWNSAELVI